MGNKLKDIGHVAAVSVVCLIATAIAAGVILLAGLWRIIAKRAKGPSRGPRKEDMLAEGDKEAQNLNSRLELLGAHGLVLERGGKRNRLVGAVWKFFFGETLCLSVFPLDRRQVHDLQLALTAADIHVLDHKPSRLVRARRLYNDRVETERGGEYIIADTYDDEVVLKRIVDAVHNFFMDQSRLRLVS